MFLQFRKNTFTTEDLWNFPLLHRYDLEKLRIENDQTVVKSMRKINTKLREPCFLNSNLSPDPPPLYVRISEQHTLSSKLGSSSRKKKVCKGISAVFYEPRTRNSSGVVIEVLILFSVAHIQLRNTLVVL